jgi:hypothetical protein
MRCYENSSRGGRGRGENSKIYEDGTSKTREKSLLCEKRWKKEDFSLKMIL